MSCSDEYLAGQMIRIPFETRVGGVLTPPTAARFKWRGPADTTTTTWVWQTDLEIIEEIEGRLYVDIDPAALRAGAYAGRWLWRWESDGVETAQEGEFRVKAANL